MMGSSRVDAWWSQMTRRGALHAWVSVNINCE